MTKMATSNKGLFISFEGIDGCGKSTQVQLLMDKLEKDGVIAMLVREPGGSTISEEIRNILLKTRSETMSARAEALLMTASRAQLTKDTILPALEEGTCVIADRYQDSTLAYQGGGRGLDVDYLIQLNTFATYSLDPDLTLTVNFKTQSCDLRTKQIYLYCRYTKHKRGLAQKQKTCEGCSGKGCLLCMNH